MIGELEARIAVYGYSIFKPDYELEFSRCHLYVYSPRHIRIGDCGPDESRLKEHSIRRHLTANRRALVNVSGFTLAFIGNVLIGSRPERYGEFRKFDLKLPLDLSLINALSLGLDVSIRVPDISPKDVINDDLARVVSKVLEGSEGAVYVEESSIEDPNRHLSVLKYVPSYAFTLVSLDTNASAESVAHVRVFPGPPERIPIRSIYARLLESVSRPEIMRDFVDEILFRLKPPQEDLIRVVDAAAILHVARFESRSKAFRLLDKGSAYGLGMISKALDVLDNLYVVELLIQKDLVEEGLRGAKGDRKLISALMQKAYELLERGRLEEALKIAKKIAPYDSELVLMFLLEALSKHPEKKALIKGAFLYTIRFLDPKEVSESSLAVMLYLAYLLKVSPEALSDIAEDIVRKACEIYESTYKTQSRLPKARPTLPILFALMLEMLKPTRGLAKDKKVRKIIREILENLRYDLTYSWYELKKAFEGYIRNVGLPPLMMIPSHLVSGYLRDLLRRVSSEEEFVLFIPLPRRERVETFAPDLLSDFEEMRKNFEQLRAEIASYLKEREAQSPGEGEGEEEV